jgi:hypothetical protein
MAEDRQGDAFGAGAGQGLGQRLILFRLRRCAEIDVVGDTGRAGGKQAIDRFGMLVARPRPALQRMQAHRIDRDDEEILGRGVLGQPGTPVRQRALDQIEPTREIHHRDQRTQQRKRSILLHGQRS